ncbi:MAG: hypothetical protein OEZ06_21610 [Myxococcales bacterium]|nr:hypothetical protein [Myxococcales bacterium]
MVPTRLHCIVALIVASFGCGEDGPTAPPPAGPGGGDGTSAPQVSSAGRDGGASSTPAAGGDEDAGSDRVFGPQANECTSFDALPFAADERPADGGYYNGVYDPLDFPVSRAELSWVGNCDHPTLRLTLSEGRCPGGDEHALSFDFDADAITVGDGLHVGLNALTPEDPTSTIRIRYNRPRPLSPYGLWGGCEGFSGLLNMAGEVSTTARSRLQGQFQLDLAACDDSGNTNLNVEGTFDLPLRRGLTELCP